ncbi:MAG: nuclear transport factor 2 family protein, partial [Brumimicrobium sp.]
ILLITALLISCESSKKENSSKVEDEISLVIDHWHKSASNADFENYFGAMNEESVFIGTDASEIWSKDEFKAFSKPHFDKGKAWDFKTLERNIYFSKNMDVAWFDELLDTWMGTCRGTGILEREYEKWKIKHYTLSVTIPNDDMNNVIEVKNENDSLFKVEYIEKNIK